MGSPSSTSGVRSPPPVCSSVRWGRCVGHDSTTVSPCTDSMWDSQLFSAALMWPWL